MKREPNADGVLFFRKLSPQALTETCRTFRKFLMAMRRINPSAALGKPGASRKYSGLQWRMFTEFGLADQSLYSSRLARLFNSRICCV